MNNKQLENDEFARLPRRDREAAFQLARKKVGVQGKVTVSLMLHIHKSIQKEN